MKPRNPVAKYASEFNKPRTFRDRKKHPSKKDEQRDHPIHEPYRRDHRNLTHDVLMIGDMAWDDELGDDDA